MLTAPPTFAALNGQDGAEPIYVLEFGDVLTDAIPTVYTTAYKPGMGPAQHVQLDYIYNYDNGSASSPYEAGVYSANHAADSAWTPYGDGDGLALNDAIYFGLASGPFDNTRVTLASLAVGAVFTEVYEYWNGSAWTAFSITHEPRPVVVGLNVSVWDLSAMTDWTPRILLVNGTGQRAWWWRSRISAFTSLTSPSTTGGQPYYWLTPDAPASASAIIASRPSFDPRQVTPLEGTSSIGSVDVELLDADGAVAALLSSHLMNQRPATLSFLWAGMPFADRLKRFFGQLQAAPRDDTGTVYTLTINDRLDRLNTQILTTDALAAEFCPSPGATRTWTQDATTVPGAASLVLKDTDSDGVFETAVISGHPANIALCMMVSGSGSGTDADGLEYDVFPAWAGAAIPMAQVDQARWLYFRDTQWPLAAMTFTLSGEENLKSFQESETFKIMNGYPTIGGGGAVGCRFSESPRSADALQQFDDKSIVSGSLKFDPNFDGYVSHVVWSWDHDGQNFQSGPLTFCSPAWMAGEIQIPVVLELQSRGLQTSSGGLATIAVVTANIFARYNRPPALVDWSAFLSQMLVEAGDVVSLSSITLPAVAYPQQPEVGDVRFIEVQSVQVDPDEVACQGIDLTGPLTSGRVCVIAPAGLPDYSDATPEERSTYAYMADVDTGLLPDDSWDVWT